MACNLHAIEQMQLRGRRRVDGVGHPKFDFHTEMDNWLPDVNKAWTATTPEGGFRAPSKFGGLGGANGGSGPVFVPRPRAVYHTLFKSKGSTWKP